MGQQIAAAQYAQYAQYAGMYNMYGSMNPMMMMRPPVGMAPVSMKQSGFGRGHPFVPPKGMPPPPPLSEKERENKMKQSENADHGTEERASLVSHGKVSNEKAGDNNSEGKVNERSEHVNEISDGGPVLDGKVD